MNKTYKFQVDCDNCGVSELLTYSFGIKRPISIICTNCGCLTDTRIAKFNQNINMPSFKLPEDFNNRKFC